MELKEEKLKFFIFSNCNFLLSVIKTLGLDPDLGSGSWILIRILDPDPAVFYPDFYNMDPDQQHFLN
jgi:hypothetical protein